MRPNTPKQSSFVKTLKGSDVIVFAVPKGKILRADFFRLSDIADTPLPDGLVLVHEFKDHYSLQASKEMTLPSM